MGVSPHNLFNTSVLLPPSTQALHLQGFFGDVYKAASAGRAALASVRQSYGRANAFAHIEAELRVFEHWSQLSQNDTATASNMVAVLAPFVKSSAIAGCGAYRQAWLRRTQALIVLMSCPQPRGWQRPLCFLFFVFLITEWHGASISCSFLFSPIYIFSSH
jgi:hypothetical protein